MTDKLPQRSSGSEVESQPQAGLNPAATESVKPRATLSAVEKDIAAQEINEQANPPENATPLLIIAAMNKRNGITLFVMSAMLLVAGLSVFLVAKAFFALGLVSFTLGLLGLVLGYAKVTQPHHSLIADRAGLAFFHRRGSYRLTWDNIVRIDVPRVSQGLESLDLPFIGFKLKKINPVLDCISPRLATGLLTEQRPLMMTAVNQGDMEQVLEQQLVQEFTPLITCGERYRGVLAMFGHRCLLLERELGYHLYISADILDDDPRAVAKRLRALKASLEYPEHNG